jgi:hypothetical protein
MMLGTDPGNKSWGNVMNKGKEEKRDAIVRSDGGTRRQETQLKSRGVVKKWGE